MRVVHVITGLAVGGAETMLQKLLRTMDREQFDPVVVSLLGGGEIAGQLQAEGFMVRDLGLTSSLVSPGAVWRLRRLARELKPQVIQGWMYHGNLAAALMARFVPGDPDLLWNIRHSVYDIGMEKPMTRVVIRLGGRLSSRPRKILFNSSTSLDQHVALGYRRDKCVMIPNGFDTDVFRPDPAARADLRRELDLEPDTILVGLVGRMHPHKGQLHFLQAAERVHRERPDVRFVMAGSGVTEMDPQLGGFLTGRDLRDRVHLLGHRSDTPRLIAGLDLLCVSSVTEAFPNVLGEAMACGVPCVTTDVGESREIVAGMGRIVRPGESEAFAQAIGELLELTTEARSDLGRRCRVRILENYTLEKIAERYAEIYLSA